MSVAAVGSRDAARAEAWAARFDVRHAFGGYEAVLDPDLIDAVYIALPNSLHAEWALRAVRAGVPVLCEKPLAFSAEEAVRIRAMSAELGVPVMEAFMYRFHPHFTRFRELVGSGVIGDVRTIDGVFTFLLDEPGTIVESRELGGGALLDVGCYAVDAMCTLAGAEPTRAQAFSRSDSVDRTTVGQVEFANGVLGRFEASIESAERHSLTVVGTAGSLHSSTPWVQGDAPTVILEQRYGQPDRVHEVPAGDAVGAMVTHFAACARGVEVAGVSLEASVRTMRVLDMLAASAGHWRPAP